MPILAGGIADAAAFGGMSQIQFGTASVIVTAATFGIVTVTFPVPFSTTPKFLTTVRSAAGASVGATVLVTALSPTTATVRVTLTGTATVSPGIDWLAIA